MNKYLCEQLVNLLNDVFSQKFSEQQFSPCKDLLSAGVRYHTYHSKDVILDSLTPADTVIVLIKGSVQIHNYGFSGNHSIQGISKAPEFIGLIEILNACPFYFSRVIADGVVPVISIPGTLFLESLHSSLDLSALVIKSLSSFSSLKMLETVNTNLYKPIDNLILFLFKYAQNHPFPKTVELKRTELSSLLHIELRTLYRYLNTLKVENLCSIEHGRLYITEQNFQILTQYIEDNNLTL